MYLTIIFLFNQAFQRKIHAHLEHLDSLNRQYRRLAREGLTDSSGQQRTQIYDINSRWDDLNNRTHAVLRRLSHMLNVHGDYEAVRQALLQWLADMDKRVLKLEKAAAKGKPPAEEHIQVGEIVWMK